MNQHEQDEGSGDRGTWGLEETARFLRVDVAGVRQAALMGQLPTRTHKGELRIDFAALMALLNPYVTNDR